MPCSFNVQELDFDALIYSLHIVKKSPFLATIKGWASYKQLFIIGYFYLFNFNIV